MTIVLLKGCSFLDKEDLSKNTLYLGTSPAITRLLSSAVIFLLNILTLLVKSYNMLRFGFFIVMLYLLTKE